ncbi:MAG: hypothetical protein ACI4SR_04730, partial [Faecalibacillus sp.]
MLNGRMIRILKYFQDHPITTYKNIASDLEMNVRNIRYDVDKINVYFSDFHDEIIKKESKGVLILNKDIDIKELLKENDYIYSIDERKNLLMLLLLFDHKQLRLNKIS